MTDPAAAAARHVIALLAPGAPVGHANPELADWDGVIAPDRSGRWHGTDDVRVRWTAGTGGTGGTLAGSRPGWHDANAVAVKGQCPGCGRPARYVSAGSQYGRAGGWHHDARADDDACQAGKAAGEGTAPGDRGPGQ